MDSIILANLIVNQEQNKSLNLFIDNISSSSIIIEKVGEYNINGDDDYISVCIIAMGMGYNKNNMVKFLLSKLNYICMRIANTDYIFTKNFGDMIDLYYDEYTKFFSSSFIKDLMTIDERYKLLIQSNSYFDNSTKLSLILEDEIIDLNGNTRELLSTEDEYEVMNDITGESHTIDITIGIDPKKIKIIVAKDLINTSK